MKRRDTHDAFDAGRRRNGAAHPQGGRQSGGKKHLEDLGFTPGSTVTLVSAMGGNVIVKVKESRVAISEEMARKIMV